MWKNYGTALVLGMVTCLPGTVLSQQLDMHQWQDRVLLLFGPAGEEAYWNQANTAIKQRNEGMRDRHMVVYRIRPRKGIDPEGLELQSADVENFWLDYGMAKRKSGWVLIGKDGGVKDKGQGLVDLEHLFALIDQMPMRKREMRSDNR